MRNRVEPIAWWTIEDAYLPDNKWVAVNCKGDGGGSGYQQTESDRLYAQQVAKQEAEAAEEEAAAAELKASQDATEAARTKRGKASYLTSGGGSGDDTTAPAKKSYLGSSS